METKIRKEQWNSAKKVEAYPEKESNKTKSELPNVLKKHIMRAKMKHQQKNCSKLKEKKNQMKLNWESSYLKIAMKKLTKVSQKSRYRRATMTI